MLLSLSSLLILYTTVIHYFLYYFLIATVIIVTNVIFIFITNLLLSLLSLSLKPQPPSIGNTKYFLLVSLFGDHNENKAFLPILFIPAIFAFSLTSTGVQPRIFQGRRVFLKYGHFDKRFMYDIQKNCPAGIILVFFLQDTLKTVFLNGNSSHRRTRTEHFFLISGRNQGTFLLFSKESKGDLPPLSRPLCA